jgi:hypothetical protein
MSEQSVCWSMRCGYVADGIVAKCVKCGGPTRSATQVHRLGWAALVMGLLLVGGLGLVAFNAVPSLLHPGLQQADGSAFNGTQEQGLIAVVGIFLIIAFGLTVLGNGIWQVVKRQRNKPLLYLAMAEMALMVLVAGGFMNALKG